QPSVSKFCLVIVIRTDKTIEDLSCCQGKVLLVCLEDLHDLSKNDLRLTLGAPRDVSLWAFSVNDRLHYCIACTLNMREVTLSFFTSIFFSVLSSKILSST